MSDYSLRASEAKTSPRDQRWYMRIVTAGAGFACVAGLLATTAGAAIQTSLPDATALPFSLGGLVPNSNVAGFTVEQYLKPNGPPGGSVIEVSNLVFDINPSSGVQRLLGTNRWQFVPFRGSTTGPGGAPDEVGVMLMGGFQLDDPRRFAGLRFSFLQMVTDSGGPGIDGGGPRGKVNADIPGWNKDPGWNFDADRTQFDYLDVPFFSTEHDPASLTLETALVASFGSKVLVLDDVTWGFTANVGGPGALTATPPVERPLGASDDLLGLYRDEFPNWTYLNEGEADVSELPEPRYEVAVILSCALLVRRRQRLTRQPDRVRNG